MRICPSATKTVLKLTATTKNPTSRKKLLRATLNGRTNAMEPATTDVINVAAPINSPMAKLPLFDLIAAKVEKTSGLPFPKARNVTPVKLSLIPRTLAKVLRFMHRKSLAAIPMVLNNKHSHKMRMINATGLAFGREQ